MILIILIINTLVLIGWGSYIHHLDKFTADKKNVHTIFWLIIIGGVILTFIIDSIWVDILYGLTGLRHDENAFVEHILITGPVEESAKFITFILLTRMFKSIKEPRDGILQAVSVALGFALIENFIYAYRYGIYVLIIRSVLSMVGHMTYAVIWGFGWAATVYTSSSKNKSPDRYTIIPLLLFAAFFHGIYNFFLVIGYPLLAILVNLGTMALFFLIHGYVKDNSPYKEYKLSEHSKAIPALEMGVRRYPESYVLNKRLGIFNIHTRKYSRAEKYLRKAKKIRTKNAGAKFYFGVSKYLNGETAKGISQMNEAIKSLPVDSRKKIVASLDKVITDKFVKNEIINNFNNERKIFVKNDISYRNERATVRGENYSRKKERNKIRSRKQTSKRIPQSGRVRGTWEQLIKERPGPVILKPYYLKRGESVVRNTSKSK